MLLTAAASPRLHTSLVAALVVGRARVPPPLLSAAGWPEVDQVIGQSSPAALAYLGDAVFELEARSRNLWPPRKLNALNGAVGVFTCAEGQCAMLERLQEGFAMTEDEQEWLRRGRNASGRGPRRLDPKVYRAASSLETLVGYLYLSDRARLEQLFEFAFADGLAEDDEDAGDEGDATRDEPGGSPASESES